MICAMALLILYGLVFYFHNKSKGRALWQYIKQKELAGNFRARWRYNCIVTLTISALTAAILIFYCAYINWGPGEVILPMPHSSARLDLVYWLWTAILYVFFIPVAETLFYFTLHTYSWPLKYGRFVIPLSYGIMNLLWILPVVIGGTIWRILLILVFTFFGYYFYKMSLRGDIGRTIFMRTIVSLSMCLMLIYLVSADNPSSPNVFKYSHPGNFFMSGKLENSE